MAWPGSHPGGRDSGGLDGQQAREGLGGEVTDSYLAETISTKKIARSYKAAHRTSHWLKVSSCSYQKTF